MLLSSSTDIGCSFESSGLNPLIGYVYVCKVDSDPVITSRESANITTIDGSATPGRMFGFVYGFLAKEITIHFFPKGLTNFFKNFEFIKIESCGLKVIQKSDLQPFGKLLYIDFSYNNIEVIEEGLFDFNPELKAVGFWESKIIHIDPKVFDYLNNLSCFWFDNVPCINFNVCDSKEKLKHAIGLVKKNCKNSGFVDLNNDIENLKRDAKILNSGALNVKIQMFERKFNASKLSGVFYLREKIDSLKN